MSDSPPTDPWGNPLPDQPARPGSPGPADQPSRPTRKPDAWWPGDSTKEQPAPPPQVPWQQPGSDQPGWQQEPVPPARRNEPMAVAALVVGILGALCGAAGCAGLVVGPVAIGLAVAARRRIRAGGGLLTGDGLAVAGLVLGIIGTTIAAVWLVILLANPDFLDELQRRLETTTTTEP